MLGCLFSLLELQNDVGPVHLQDFLPQDTWFFVNREGARNQDLALGWLIAPGCHCLWAF